MASEQVIIEYKAEIGQLSKDLDELIQQQEELGAGVKKFNKIFFESEKARTAAINKEKATLKTLKAERDKAFKTTVPVAEYKKLTKAVSDQEAQLKKLEKSTVKTTKATTKQTTANKGLSKSFGNIGVAIAAAFSIGAITNFLNQTTKLVAEFDALRLSFEFIEGDKQGGAETFQFLTDLSEKLGLELKSTAEAFKLFSGAARISGISAEETKRIFESVSFAVTALGLSANKAESVFRALSQIISKGTVSSEELRQQMAEVLPGSFKIAADSMGKTEAEFNKLLSTGTLLATDFLPKFADQLRTVFSEGAVLGAQSLNAELNRLENQITALTLEIGETTAPAWLKFKKFGLDALSSLIDSGRVLKEIFNGLLSGTDINTVKPLTEAEKLAKATKFITDAVNKDAEDNFNKEVIRLEARESKIKELAEQGLISEKQYAQGIDKVRAELADKETIRQETLLASANKNAVILQGFLDAIENAPLNESKDGIKLFSDDQINKIDDIKLKLSAIDDIIGGIDKITPVATIAPPTAADLAAIEKAAKAEADRLAKALAFIKEQRRLDFEATQDEIENDDKQTKLFFDNLDKKLAYSKLIDDEIATLKQKSLFEDVATKDKTERISFATSFIGIEESDLAAEHDKIDLLVTQSKATFEEGELAKLRATEKFKNERIRILTELNLTEADLIKSNVSIWLEENEKILQATSDIFNQIAALSGNVTNGRIDDLTREQNAFEEKLDKDRELLESSREDRLITEADFQSKLKSIDDQEEANAERIRKEKNKIAKKQAILEKAGAIFSIGIHTAEAIIATLAKTPPPAGIPLAALVAALGALQLGTVLATPIPKFAKGTKDKKGSGMALVGEQGPEQTYLASGTKVLPAKQTKTYGQVFDAMYDNRFDQYITANYVAPALEQQKRLHKAQENQDFASNIVNSIQETNIINSVQGFDYYDGLAIQKKGQRITNADEIGKAIAGAIQTNSRRL